MSPTHDPSHYFNRELSQLAFQFRVLEQARDAAMPLLERLRFLCISASNLDEFFEIRVAALLQQKQFGTPVPTPDGTSPTRALQLIRDRTVELIDEQYRLWNKVLRPALEKQRIRVLSRSELDARQRAWLKTYFEREILPVLSPLGIDPSHPFPRILNKSLNFVVSLSGRDAFGRQGNLAIVRVPRPLPRVIRLPESLGSEPGMDFVTLSAVLQEFMEEIFPGMKVKGAYQFRVTRNSELLVDEDDVENLAHALKDELKGRGFARAVRIEVADSCPKGVLKFLCDNFELTETDVFRCNGPVNLSRLSILYDLIERADLKFPGFVPQIHPELRDTEQMFARIGTRDVLLHHPFDSFTSIVDLLREAAADPNVLAIKQTLYRAGNDSPLVNSLIDAARNGKDVTVVVELRARFDEEANLLVANRLQEAGVQVVYGVVGYKCHAKMLLIVRREAGKLRRYVHLGTGNYHTRTSKLYTDYGLLTANADIGADVHSLFMQLSGLSPAIKLKRLLASPFTLHMSLLAKIEREAGHARQGKPARIIAKINHLNEARVIDALYAASAAGVKIDLIVRGTCALRPGVKGLSDNIQVRSIVGRFLEHTRVYWFANDGATEIWCASADWLERNLLRRIEVCFPILDEELARRVYEEELENYLADNTQSWQLGAEGTYTRRLPEGDEMPHSAQGFLMSRSQG